MNPMNKHFFTGAFLLGACAILWVATGFFGSHGVALTMTVLIGAVYGFGAWELQRFRQASATLDAALHAIPAPLQQLDDWLLQLHASLQNPVRLRIEGERVGLPGPALTPYLVGLLVMLGMLGTFLGMVVTLNGAVFALESTSDLQTIRNAFATPIKGLGLAFGTSVAGVAASAMLGLMSALSRRERMAAAQLLDSKIAGPLRSFSLGYQRQQTYQALQQQSQALPAVVSQLQSMMAQMERMSLQLNERLLSNQDNFHRDVKSAYTDLAGAVDQSLRDSLAQSARIAGESIAPLVQSALSGIAQEAQHMHVRMVEATQQQLDSVSARFETTATAVADRWSAALAQQEGSSSALVSKLDHSLTSFGDRFEQRSAALLQAVREAYTGLQAEQTAGDRQRLQAWTGSLETMAAALQLEWQQRGDQTLLQQQALCNTWSSTAQEIAAHTHSSARSTLAEVERLVGSAEELLRARMASEAGWTTQHGERMDQMATLLRTELTALRDAEALRGQAAVERLGELQTALTLHLSTLGTALEDPITRLIATASEAPRAAAEVIGKLRQEVSGSMARDNALLEERSRIMETLNTLLESINHAAAEQRAVIDTLVAASAKALQEASVQFAAQVGTESGKLADISAHVSSSAVEVSTLSETFAFAVRSFNEANEKLIANLQRIEAAMDKSMGRSDEQLAYYVAQAREIMDLSVMSQKNIFEELRQLAAPQASPQAEAA